MDSTPSVRRSPRSSRIRMSAGAMDHQPEDNARGLLSTIDSGPGGVDADVGGTVRSLQPWPVSKGKTRRVRKSREVPLRSSYAAAQTAHHGPNGSFVFRAAGHRLLAPPRAREFTRRCSGTTYLWVAGPRVSAPIQRAHALLPAAQQSRGRMQGTGVLTRGDLAVCTKRRAALWK